MSPPTRRPEGAPFHPQERPLLTALLLIALAVPTLTGCGYTYGMDNFGAPAGVHRVAVEVADNRTFRQDVEVGLTREIHEALIGYSDLRPSPRAGADAILRVEIDSIINEALIRDATPVREGSFDFEATVTLVESSTGSVLRKRQVRDRGEFRLPVGETATTATNEALTDLARKIVLALEGGF